MIEAPMFFNGVGIRHAGNIVTDDPGATRFVGLRRVHPPGRWQCVRLLQEDFEQLRKHALRFAAHPVDCVMLVHALIQKGP